MNMYYYKQMDLSGCLIGLVVYYDYKPTIKNALTVEIMQEEYKTLLAEIEAANQPEEPDPDEISDTEALNIILGVSE